MESPLSFQSHLFHSATTMKKHLAHLTIGFVTFTIGVVLALLFLAPANPSPVKVEQVLVATKPAEPVPAVEDTKPDGPTSLTILVEASEPNPNPPSQSTHYIKLNKKGSATFDLDLGENIDGQEVSLNYKDQSSEYRMFERYRTSMTISMEGPHIDLVDWRHFDSEWTPLTQLGPLSFRTLAGELIDRSKFPPVTKAEILKEVRKRAGVGWGDPAELVKDCNGPDEGQCLVSVSSIYLRVQKKVSNRWIDVGLVEIRVPMGC